ncbi:hypothetical protein WN51_04350 [Melipona quadrifasciata]|uniref:Odorant receptor n=1 Tax=Melipona quadrifasciata TaxID=166423 RepID=A0A0M8ZTH8_9HYME|nr:hypothetical protein WN51_04350 [Melipona quadrifasciata]
MNVLRPAFNILIVCGCWMPPSCRTSHGKLFYTLYTTFVILLLYSFCISQFLNVILNVNTADELSDSLYMFISSVLSCCKIFALLINRKAIGVLSRQLEEEPCKPVDAQEITVQKKFDRSIGNLELAYRAWLPFNYSVPNYYYMAYAHQIVALIGTALVNVACDVLVCGLFVHVCSQQEILKHRIKGLTKQSRPDIGKVNVIIIPVSMFFHCPKVYLDHTEQVQGNNRYSTFIEYSRGVLHSVPIVEHANKFQIHGIHPIFELHDDADFLLLLVWESAETEEQSVEVVDAIFEMDWVLLDNDTQKCLINVMRRGMSPIELTCAYVFTMDLKTFVSVTNHEPLGSRSERTMTENVKGEER